VLRLWPEPVRVGLFPERVLALSAGAAWRRAAPARSQIRLSSARAQPEPEALLPQIVAAVQALGLARVGGVTLLLSNHFVRYQALAWSEALARPEDWLAFARHKFAKAHGVEAASWDIRVTPAAAGMPRVASAIKAGLHEGLRLGLEAAGLKLHSLQPALMAGVARVWPQVDEALPSWLVSHEPGIVALGLLADQAWQSVRLRKVGDDWLEELPQLLAREAQLLGVTEPISTLLLDAPCMEALPPRLGDYTVQNPGLSAWSAADRASGHALLGAER
jgi:hypothetical protein